MAKTIKIKKEKKGKPKRRYKDRWGMYYSILSYLKQMQTIDINMLMIDNYALRSSTVIAKDLVFELSNYGAISVIPNKKKGRYKRIGTVKSNSRAYYSITPKGLLLYEKLAELKKYAGDSIIMEDYVI